MPGGSGKIVCRIGKKMRDERVADDREICIIGGGLTQVTSNPAAEAVSSQSPVCNVQVGPSPPLPPSPPPPPVVVADVIVDVPLVDDNLQSAISVQTNVPIAGFQFDVVDNNLNPVSIASE